MKHCPNCNRSVLPTTSGNCPACRMHLAESVDIEATDPGTSPTISAAQSNPFHREPADIERLKAADRHTSRLRYCWMIPLILLISDFVIRQVIFQFSSVIVLEAWWIACILAGIVALVNVMIIRRRSDSRGIQVAAGHRIAGAVLSIILIGWIGLSFYSLKKIQQRAGEIYQRQHAP
jgi:hypothetical protein